MEDTLSLIGHGCKLARDLELNLPKLRNQPDSLASFCDNIVRFFNKAMDQLNAHSPSSYLQMAFPESQESRPSELDVGVHEWLRSNPQAMDLLQAQVLPDKKPFEAQFLTNKSPFDVRVLLESKMGAMDMDYAGDIEGSTRSRGGGEFQAAEGSYSGQSPVVQRSRKRKDSVEMRTIREAAPRVGNMEIPPDDGLTWRKYGQKEILRSRFPRSYYRCTHKSFYGCDAKKQVQRLDDDPNTFEITYYGRHTCLMSPTPSAGIHQSMVEEVTQPPISASIPRWFPLEFESKTETGINTYPMDLHLGMYRDCDMGGAASSPSQARHGKEAECPLVLADAMFNSGSSSDSMDTIFPPQQEK